VRRENVPQLREQWSHASQRTALREAQILIHTPVPCGGVAECGVCAVTSKSGWKLACRDGPVFDWREL
jgi:dihydroorotate dehydrogenase electron transfer subunit